MIVICLLVPALNFIPGIMGKIPYPSAAAQYTDLMLTHYPNLLYLRNAILAFRQIPLWSPLIHSGAPFAANPLAGVFYLPGWLAMAFPLPEGISITLAAHVVFGTYGMFRLLKVLNAGELAATVGALVFGLMPKLAAHYGAGHVTLIYAISWTPWLFSVSLEDRRGWKTGLIAAMLFLADPRWSIFAGVFWFSFHVAYRQIPVWNKTWLYYLKAGSTAFLVASPLIFPLVEYIRLSTRTRMDLGDMQAFSLPPAQLLGLLIPTGGANPEWYLYPGGVVLGMFILQLFFQKARNRNLFWNIWILAALLISLGSWLIRFDWFIQLPVLSLVRVPSRALFLVGFSFSVITARSFDSLISGEYNPIVIKKISFGQLVFSLGLAIPIFLMRGDLPGFAIWGFGFLGILALTLLLFFSEKNLQCWSWMIIGLIVVDLLGAGYQSMDLRSKEDIWSSDLVQLVEKDQSYFRIYSPSYSVPQYFAAENNLEMVDGVDPLHLAVYADFMEETSGVEAPGYWVTIPPFRTGDPEVDNIDAAPDPFLLSLLDAKYIISNFELANSQLSEISTSGKPYIYKNGYWTERAWVEDSSRSSLVIDQSAQRNVDELTITPNRIEVIAVGPGRLVLSEIIYPGWKVFIDGDPNRLERAYGLLRSVELAEGKHQIVFKFQPETVFWGLGLAAVGWLIAGLQISKKHKI
jgi:hypothetical protein